MRDPTSGGPQLPARATPATQETKHEKSHDAANVHHPRPCFTCPGFGSHNQHSQHTCAHWNLTQVTRPMSRPVFPGSGSMREDVRLLATAHPGTCSIPMMLSGTCSLPSSVRCSRAGTHMRCHFSYGNNMHVLAKGAQLFQWTPGH